MDAKLSSAFEHLNLASEAGNIRIVRTSSVCRLNHILVYRKKNIYEGSEGKDARYRALSSTL